MSADADFLQWLYERLVNVYGESRQMDFVQRVQTISERLRKIDRRRDA